MKMVAASPLLAQIAAQNLYAKSAAAVGVATKGNVYTRLGVKTIINCRGTWTYLSGSLQFPEVHAAQAEAAHHFVNMVELQQAAGRKLAELTGAESGMITSGAAGAMAASAAACIAGTDGAKIWQLPDTTGMKHEVIMAGGRSAFDSAIRLTGAKLVLVESPDEVANAINDRTAMIYTTDLGDKLAKESAENRQMRHCLPATTMLARSYQVTATASGAATRRNADSNCQHGTSWSAWRGLRGLTLHFGAASQALGLHQKAA